MSGRNLSTPKFSQLFSSKPNYSEWRYLLNQISFVAWFQRKNEPNVNWILKIIQILTCLVWSWKVLGGKRCDCSRIWQLLARCHQPSKLEEFYWSTPRLWFWGGRRDRKLLPHFVQSGLEEDIPCSNLRTGCPMSAPLESDRLGLKKSISKTYQDFTTCQRDNSVLFQGCHAKSK